ncbi:MAG TPA: signal peptidase II [Gemmatimonadaceae bacterium]|nr:signal peptidase II [Gemmatimonadaceae bacterium]
MIVRRGPFDRLALTASLVFIADFATKQWAVGKLGGDRSLGAGWHLTVVRNTHLAGGLRTGGFELPLTAVLTAAVAALVFKVCRQLSTIDESAPLTLGLLVGAGVANLADALLPPHGVVDFIAFTNSHGLTTSFNVADVLLAIGLVLCVRITWRIALSIRGRVFSRDALWERPFSGVFPMRDRVLLSAGHALLAMCAFVWLYSIAVAFTPDAGRSAPNSLLCGVGIFAVAFVASQAWFGIADRRLLSHLRSLPNRSMERVVLDSSLPAAADHPPRRPRLVPRGDVVSADEHQAPRHADNA